MSPHVSPSQPMSPHVTPTHGSMQRSVTSTNQRIAFDIDPSNRHLATGGEVWQGFRAHGHGAICKRVGQHGISSSDDDTVCTLSTSTLSTSTLSTSTLSTSTLSTSTLSTSTLSTSTLSTSTLSFSTSHLQDGQVWAFDLATGSKIAAFQAAQGNVDVR
ncbi:unnamed protein product, partial [Closterium sp. NIES-54]